MKKIITFLLGILLCQQTASIANELHVAYTYQQGGMPLYAPEGRAVWLYDDNDAPVVSTVVRAVNNDIKAVVGGQLDRMRNGEVSDYAIIVGTIGLSKYISELGETGKINVEGIKGKWESYILQLVDSPRKGIKKALVICGSNPRGTAYGLFEVSRMMGISPYVWWADVVPDHQMSLYLVGDLLKRGEPSVKYRGIFINDEDWGILPWAKNGIDAVYKNIGPNTYAQVAELLLRLRANTLWPASHGASKAFWTLKGNLEVAKKYAIIMSSGNPMLRDNLWEWPRFGGTSKNYSYSTNKDMMLRYWAERVGQSRGYEAIYDISTRGFQDEPLLGYSSQKDALVGISELIAEQRKLLGDSIGGPATVPQIYLPYKEALDLYNAGLRIPDDVTLCWVDDNFGYIRQLPTKTEQMRSGGNGVYYHLSYLGTPAPYLWLSSLSPSFLSFELSKGYQHGVQRFWMFNVGDIKPAEEELEFCMDLAWNIESWPPQDAYKYSRYWAAKTFGESYADAIGEIKNEYYALASQCKPELINRMDYSDEECNQRIDRYRKLIGKVDNLKGQIPLAKRDAFFELVEYPVKGAAEMNIKILRAQQSWFYAAAGKKDSTSIFTKEVAMAYDNIMRMTEQYNHGIAGGKWNMMMNSKPYGGSVFDMPIIPTIDDVNEVEFPILNPSRCSYLAKDYVSKQGNIMTIENMGVAGSCVSVWPMDKHSYSASTYMNAPMMEFDIKVMEGRNRFVVRCLPSFPTQVRGELRVGLEVDGGRLSLHSIKLKAMSGKWNTAVAEGYTDATIEYMADRDKRIRLKVFFMDPGLAVSDIIVETEHNSSGDLTDKLLVNADFEMNSNGEHVDGKGVPYGWTMNILPTGGSHGINADAANPHNDYCCWVIARPFPQEFILYQTIPTEKLEAGWYRISCMLWNQNGISGNCRLFANKSVQYFASPEGVCNILTEGEHNSYASYQGTTTADATMKPMSVYVYVRQGEDLLVGIKSSNRKNNGSLASGNDPTGWFKVDHFTIEKIQITTGLHDLNRQMGTPMKCVYNMAGQKVGGDLKVTSLPKGIYVSEGKKWIVP